MDQYKVTIYDQCLEATFTAGASIAESLITYEYNGSAVTTTFTPATSTVVCPIVYELVIVDPGTGAETVQPLWSYN